VHCQTSRHGRRLITDVTKGDGRPRGRKERRRGADQSIERIGDRRSSGIYLVPLLKNFPRQCDGAFAPSSESSRATNESVVQKNNELVLEEQKLSLVFAFGRALRRYNLAQASKERLTTARHRRYL